MSQHLESRWCGRRVSDRAEPCRRRFVAAHPGGVAPTLCV